MADSGSLRSLDTSGIALDLLLDRCLTDAGVWTDGQASDGHEVVQLFEHTDDRLHLRGRVWEITAQTLHVFWLDITRDGALDRFSWFVYFDVAAASKRELDRMLNRADDPEAISWRARLAGEVTLEGDKLVVVADSARVLVRDMPEPAQPRPPRRPRTRDSSGSTDGPK